MSIPFVPCYESDQCGSVHNCANDSMTIGNTECDTKTSEHCSSKDGFKENSCFGSNANYCSGITRFWEDLPQELSFSNLYNNPARTSTTLNYFGCTATEQNNGEQKCMEFETDSDEAANCQEACWESGGSLEIREKCQALKKDECSAMSYFCEIKNDGKCGAKSKDPYREFIDTHGQDNTNIYTTRIVPHESMCEFLTPLTCKYVPGIPKEWTLTCSKSAWNSKQITSYAPRARICCLDKHDGSQPICISNPRCQFVDSPSKCVFKNGKFMCSYNYNTKEAGYCTWCRRQADENQEFAPISNTFVKKVDEWDTLGYPNRCPTFNECEVKDSEKLFNKCMWDRSNNTLGVNPTLVDNDPSLLRTHGYCSPNCENKDANDECFEAKKIEKICDNELSTISSSKNRERVDNPGFAVQNACTERSLWHHACTNYGRYNYACTWCPSLQDKEGFCDATLVEHVDQGLSMSTIISIAGGVVSAIVIIIVIVLFALSHKLKKKH